MPDSTPRQRGPRWLGALCAWGLFPLAIGGVIALLVWRLASGQPITPIQFAAPSVVVAVVWLAERAFPLREDWARSRGDVLDDLASMFLLVGATGTLLTWLGDWLGPRLADAHHVDEVVQQTPVWAQAAIAFLVLDLGRYVLHRLSHRVSPLWSIHAAHHVVERVHLLNAYRSHPLYAVISYLTSTLVLLALGFDADALAAAVILDMSVVPFTHANLRMHTGWLKRVFVTIETHRWHHARDLGEGHHNFGAALTLWDQLFGTYMDRPHDPVAEVGIVGGEHYPKGYFPYLLLPLRWRALREQDRRYQAGLARPGGGAGMRAEGGVEGRADASPPA